MKNKEEFTLNFNEPLFSNNALRTNDFMIDTDGSVFVLGDFVGKYPELYTAFVKLMKEYGEQNNKHTD